MIEITYDREPNCWYFQLNHKKVKRTKEVEPGISFDYDEKGRVVGIEVIR